ncbi:hypothetical protein [Paenibacillus sp. UNC217MF]|uniref:hypothetical protein n=1 Tax=Paenibacillus sp. UNC217MF TaxID=1449062 RepID=UPI00048AC9C3|nr:hypothetical protein [Paenibacillus sp. UNC217MF]
MDTENGRIYCNIYGYCGSVAEWIKKSVELFSNNGFPLKSVSYDVNYQKLERKSLNKFQSEITEMNEESLENLFSFTIFKGRSMKVPSSWEYGVRFDKPSRELQIFFNTSLEMNHTQTLVNLLKAYIDDKIINFGYFSYDTIWSKGESLDLYMEDNHSWWLALNPRNRDILYNSSPKLRHIYPINIINREFLEYEDATFSFKDWVKNPEHGALEEIGQGNWLWTVPGERLHEIGKLIYDKKLLIGVKGQSFGFV